MIVPQVILQLRQLDRLGDDLPRQQSLERL
jgi:hypothetical protein